MILFGAILGFVLTIVSVMSAWLVLGGGSLMRRLLIAAGIVSAAGLAFCFAIEPEAEWLIFVGLSLLIHSIGFLLLRTLGYRLQPNGKTYMAPNHDELKFSVSQIMLLTVVIAVVAWLGSGFLAMGSFHQLALFALVATSCLVVSLTAAWNLWMRPSDCGTPTCVVTAVIATFLFIFFEWTDANPGAAWASTAVTFAAFFWLVCHMAKRSGLDVVKLSEASLSEPEASYR